MSGYKKILILVITISLVTFTLVNTLLQAGSAHEKERPIASMDTISCYMPAYANDSSGEAYMAYNTTDGDPETFWISKPNTCNQWIYVDLGKSKKVDRVKLDWYDSYYPEQYRIMVSDDALDWQHVLSVHKEIPGSDIHDKTFRARYVGIMMDSKAAHTQALGEIEIMQSSEAAL